MKNRYLIIGGVAGGATTAARLRRIDEESDIILFERGEHISYANCGLPYYIGDVIPERENLFVQTPEAFYERFRVSVRTNNEVLRIDKEKQQVEVKNLVTDEVYTETYDKLILSPGAAPVRPPIPGIENNKNIFTLRNVNDTDRIKEFINQNKPKRAVIVGAGFIGLEMAENLHDLGIFVTIVEMADQVMSILDYEMAATVHQHLKTKNVEFYLKDGVASFEKMKDDKIGVKLNSGTVLESDIVILSIGVKPELNLATDADLKVGEAGGISVNEYLQTSDENIYALGDAIEYKNPIIDKNMLIPLAGPANKQGRIVANNIVFGNKQKYKGTIGTGIAKVFDLTVASTGVSEKVLKKHNIPYKASITHSSSHAGYYPGAQPMSVKLIFSPDDGKILGAQIVGYEGVDKRIDVIASLIGLGKTVYDLQEVEHAYAPPYSSAKDPVNIAAFAAGNIIENRMKIIHAKDLENTQDIFLLDVRTEDEVQLGMIEGAVNIPLDSLRSRIHEVPKDKKVVVYCGVGLRGYVAVRILMQHGVLNVYNLSGGYKTYELYFQKQSNEDIFEHYKIHVDDSIVKEGTKCDASGLVKVNACGLQCPGPILKLKDVMDEACDGSTVEVMASDPGFYQDVQAWCNVTGNELISRKTEKANVIATIRKGKREVVKHAVSNSAVNAGGNNKTLVVFSDDFDKALATFVIANGAAAMGRKVTLFFTFWGLNIIKKDKPGKVKKDFMGKMFSKMLPNSSKDLKLSKMNMNGMGTAMMRGRMKSLKIDSLEEMIQIALKNGVEFIACQMSMDVMGVKKEEFIDGVTIGGVASYLAEAEKSDTNLFV